MSRLNKGFCFVACSSLAESKSMSKQFLCLILNQSPTAVAFSFPADAQQRAKVAKIGWLGPVPLPQPPSSANYSGRELRALGYVEGKNITFEYR